MPLDSVSVDNDVLLAAYSRGSMSMENLGYERSVHESSQDDDCKQNAKYNWKNPKKMPFETTGQEHHFMEQKQQRGQQDYDHRLSQLEPVKPPHRLEQNTEVDDHSITSSTKKVSEFRRPRLLKGRPRLSLDDVLERDAPRSRVQDSITTSSTRSSLLRGYRADVGSDDDDDVGDDDDDASIDSMSHQVGSMFTPSVSGSRLSSSSASAESSSI